MNSIENSAKIITDFLSEDVPTTELPVCDAIFVFGHINKQVAEHSGRLFLEKKAPLIIISGGIGTTGRDPSGFPSEAEYFADILKSMGIPDDKIVLEKKATNTLENVIFGIEKVREQNLVIQSLILVSLPFLLKRSAATFRQQFPEVQTYPSAFYVESFDLAERKVNRLVAEIDRLVKYAEKGDISEVSIPAEVWNAYDDLKNR